MPAILSSALSLPPATRALTGTLIAASLLFLLLRLSVTPHDLKTIFGATGDVSLVFPWLVLVPGKVVWAPWTLLTSAFVETNLVEASPSLPFGLSAAARASEALVLLIDYQQGGDR